MSDVIENETVRIEINLTELKERLSGAKLLAAADEVLGTLAREVEIMAAPYPAEGTWNTPGPYPARWYQRHFGPRWALKAGGVHGKDTSEQMQKRWRTRRAKLLEWAVENSASYAQYVQGEEQAEFHARHGWRKLSTIARETIDRLSDDIVRRVAEKWLGEEV